MSSFGSGSTCSYDLATESILSTNFVSMTTHTIATRIAYKTLTLNQAPHISSTKDQKPESYIQHGFQFIYPKQYKDVELHIISCFHVPVFLGLVLQTPHPEVTGSKEKWGI